MVWAGHKKLAEIEGEALIMIIWAECGGFEAHISSQGAVRHHGPDIECFAPNPVMGVVSVPCSQSGPIKPSKH